LTLLSQNKKLIFRRVNVSPTLHGGTSKKARFAPNPNKGRADIDIWVKNGPYIALELKAPGGKLSEAQMAFRDEIQAVGHRYEIADSLDRVIELMHEVGVA
jgi:hypothetical protein